MAVTLFGLASCDSVKKARAWLASDGVEFRFHDFKRDGLTQAQLATWLKVVDWQTLLNRKGTTWRRLDDAARAAVHDAASASALMIGHPSLVKRPVVQWADASISVGFDAARFAEHSQRCQI